jgi:hypothetical protein
MTQLLIFSSNDKFRNLVIVPIKIVSYQNMAPDSTILFTKTLGTVGIGDALKVVSINLTDT